MPDVFTNNLDSIILQSKDEDDIVCECVEQITKLNNDKNKLFSMRNNVRKHLLETRTWNKVINTWDSFFDSYNTKLRKVHNMQNKFRFHLLGLPHLPTSKLYNACAFTQKNVKLAKMLLDLGHQVFLYGAKTLEGPQPECTEFIETHTLADICQDYGDGDNRWEIGYDWQSGQFRHDINQQRKPSTLKYYAACISEINQRKMGDDFLLITQGRYQQPIDQGVGLTLTCEPGIGYRGSYCKYRAFESSYIQNFTYGSQHPYASIDGNYYDRVIPNYFSDEDVEFGDGKGGYYLYIGRMIARKGISTAIKTCNHLGVKLLLVGQGAKVDSQGVLHGEDFTAHPGTWEYVGYADFEKRKGLFANAIATFTPTLYCDPFCGTHVEAMLSGTPVVTTNFGVFPETVINGLNGYRCNTLQQFVDAAIACKSLDRKLVRQSAEKYLCGPVSLMYEEWFVALHNLYESMYDKNKLGWHRLRDTPPSS